FRQTNEAEKMELEKTNRMNTLFEFYGSLLTDKQQEYLHLYYAEDYSLGEIASEFDVSRQAVYDNIRRTEALLTTYEEKLHLIRQFESRSEKLEKIEADIRQEYPHDEELARLTSELEKEKDKVKGEQYGI